jgi:hypothetical protein
MAVTMTYPEIYSKLTYETAVVVFIKKNGEVRIMLATRNLTTISLLYGFQGNVLGGHDNRCNINNGNIAVFDMIAGDARSFSVDRLLDIQFAGVIATKEDYDKVLQGFVSFKEEYEKTKPMMIDIDSFE